MLSPTARVCIVNVADLDIDLKRDLVTKEVSDNQQVLLLLHDHFILRVML